MRRPSYWLAGGACCRAPLAHLPRSLNELWNWLTLLVYWNPWLAPPQRLPSPLKWVVWPRKKMSIPGAVPHRSSLKQSFCRFWSGFNSGLKSITKLIFASLWKLFRGKRWQSNLWIDLVYDSLTSLFGQKCRGITQYTNGIRCHSSKILHLLITKDHVLAWFGFGKKTVNAQIT